MKLQVSQLVSFNGSITIFEESPLFVILSAPQLDDLVVTVRLTDDFRYGAQTGTSWSYGASD